MINDQWIFRFPKHARAVPLINNELIILPLLTYLPLNLPQPKFIGKPNPDFPYPFYGHKFLTGQTADRCSLSSNKRINLIEPLANFLKQLHAFPIDQALARGLNYDSLQRINPRLRFSKTQERMAYLLEKKILLTSEPWLTFFARYQNLAVDDIWILGHGDLYARHLIVNEQRGLAGIIDWGDSEIMHPAVDLAIVYQFIPYSEHYKFWQIYGDISENTHLLAKLRAIFSAISMTWYSHQVNDHFLMQESLTALNLMAESI